MEIFIRPLDTQFYRSGLPFDAGENDEAVSFFPPYPRTLYGAFRTKGILGSGGDFDKGNWNKDIYGDENRFGSIELKGPILCRKSRDVEIDDEIFLPVPLDVVGEKDGLGLKHLVPSSNGVENFGWDLRNVSLIFPNEKNASSYPGGSEVESLADEYVLPFNDLGEDYLAKNDLTSSDIRELVSKETIFLTEDRIGIARRADTHTAVEGRLYRAAHTRMNDKPESLFEGHGVFVKLDGYDSSFPEKGLIQLGGEFRAASYVKVRETNWWEKYKDRIVNKIAESGRFKAYFITPAIFKQGSLPDVCEGNPYLDIQGLSGKFRFNLISVCTAKPKMIGGWDIKAKAPKAMRPAVPEGSVYFFQYENSENQKWGNIAVEQRQEIAEAIYNQYNFETWCSKKPWDNEYGPGKEGFGIALIGGW